MARILCGPIVDWLVAWENPQADFAALNYTALGRGNLNLGGVLRR
jgi:hypothetical protein